MNSLENMKLDFDLQVRELKKIQIRKKFNDCIFIGSGDSYAAGLIAEYLTGHNCRCYSPSDLFNSTLTEDRIYCFVSASGKTTANVTLAERASGLGAKTVAITFDKNSKLAQVCDEVVSLNINRSEGSNSGFITFVANVITCLQIAGLTCPSKFDLWQKKGIEMSLDLIDTVMLPKETLFILGNNTLYAIALYASLKLSEFFCSSAVAHKLEEYCHSPIFGIKQSDHIWVMGQKEEATSNRLRKLGLHLSYVELSSQDVFTQLFVSIFFVQNLMLLLAKKYGYNQLQYPLRQDILKASSDIIYGHL